MRFRQYLVPLQAFFALFVCLGIAWMIFVMAGFNPTPPTTMELQLRSTQDGSYASMNSTAAALAFEMIAAYIPTPILLPVTGATTTPTALVTATLQSAYTPPPSLTPTSTLLPAWTSTSTRERRSDGSTATWTVPPPTTIPPTISPTIRPTNTATITLTPRQPTSTATIAATDEPTPVPSATAEPTQPATELPTTEVTPITETPVEPTETPTPE